MKRTLVILLCYAISYLCLADNYTLVFKDSGTGSDKSQRLTSSSPADFIALGEDYVESVSSANCYLAKTGYGLKMGTTTAEGSITLTLKDTYRPTRITVTAAAYSGKQDSLHTKCFMLNNLSQPFTSGTLLTEYEFTFDGKTDVNTVTVSAQNSSYNRLYLSKIVIEAPDPAPDRGEILCAKTIDLGHEHLSAGMVQTMVELDVTARNLASNINLSLADTSHCFSVSMRSLPKEGGVLQLNFSTTKKERYSATLIMSATGLDEQPVRKEVPVSINVCSELYHSGEADDPYTVQDALSRMEELEANQTSTEWWYVRGYVASDTIAVSASTAGLSFNLAWDNDTVYVYALTAQAGAIIDVSSIHKGDTLLIYSRLQNYVGYKQSHKEVYMGYLVSDNIPATDWSQLQTDYYSSINLSSDTALFRLLGRVISGGIRYTYGSGTHHTWDAFYHTDREENSMLVLDMYSNNKRYFSEQNPVASVSELDIEHMFPKSWWGGTVNNAYKDLHHLVPADYSANRSKGNDAPGEVLYPGFDNGSMIIGQPQADCPAVRVFSPADEYKGDFARAYFYILTAYPDIQWDMTTPAASFLDPHKPLLLQPWAEQLLLDWHRQDPVSEKEIKRQSEVARIQHNRNPFIDYPCLAEYIWGDKQNDEVVLSQLLSTTSVEYSTTADKSGCTCSTSTGLENMGTDEYPNGYSPSYPSGASYSSSSHSKTQKLLINGRLIILHNGQQYTITGQKVVECMKR